MAQVVDLAYVFSAPIAAVIEADFMAARQFARYIEEFGFTRRRDDPAAASDAESARPTPLGDLKMVSFTYEQPGPDGSEPRTLRIPALSLVPLPLLQVQSADFDFAVRVLDGRATDAPRPVRLLSAPEGSELPPPEPLRWSAMLVPERKEREGRGAEEVTSSAGPSLDANIKAKVAVRRADLPAGIVRLLSLMNENMQLVWGHLDLDKRKLELAPGTTGAARLALHDPDWAPLPGHRVKAFVPRDSGLELFGNGVPWASGAELPADEEGCIRLQVSCPAASSVPPGQQQHWEVQLSTSIEGRTYARTLSIQVRGG